MEPTARLERASPLYGRGSLPLTYAGNGLPTVAPTGIDLERQKRGEGWSTWWVPPPLVAVLRTAAFADSPHVQAEEAGAAPAIPGRGAWLATTCGQLTIRVSSVTRHERAKRIEWRRVKELNLQCTARRMLAFEASGLAACPNPSRQALRTQRSAVSFRSSQL